jgi:hypothetical protein
MDNYVNDNRLSRKTVETGLGMKVPTQQRVSRPGSSGSEGVDLGRFHVALKTVSEECSI